MLKRLFLDIETSPNIVLSWRVGYKLNVSYENIVKERAIICVAYKWEGEKEVHTLKWDKDQDDKAMLIKLLPVLNEADEIVAHFGDSFDMPWIRTRFLFHGLTFPAYKTVDTLQWVRRKFYFNSNKLDYVAKFLGIGQKLRTGDGLWRRIVLDRDKASLDFMVKYNAMDVILLEKVWKKLSLVVAPKSHKGVMDGNTKWSCPRCGSSNVIVSKTRVTALGVKQYQMKCKSDGGYFSISQSAHREYEAERL